MNRYFIYSLQYTLIGNTSFGMCIATCVTAGEYPSYREMADIHKKNNPNWSGDPTIISMWEVNEADYESFNLK